MATIAVHCPRCQSALVYQVCRKASSFRAGI
ncbi:hypothetical protein FH968_23025 [Buttiauxella sp. B2]|nr:hypothetical protein FH968_23025 [Buttiauxella sp. B2]